MDFQEAYSVLSDVQNPIDTKYKAQVYSQKTTLEVSERQNVKIKFRFKLLNVMAWWTDGALLHTGASLSLGINVTDRPVTIYTTYYKCIIL